MLTSPTFDYIKDQVVITNTDGIILYVNEALEETTGYKKVEVIGKKPSLWGGLMPKSFYELMWKKLRNEKKAIRVLITNKRKDGKMYDALLRISPILDTQGDVQMYVGIETVLSETE
ncbi:TPA: hypothetical protein DCQ44_02645 [Candidatus Taylorbacteria bacterium]|nr:hypothetical protein [Candidatus Taylorbacteria bacterium]